MMPTKSIEKRLSNFAGKKAFTGRIVETAIDRYRAGLIPHDISRDYYTRLELGEKLERIKNCSSILELRQYSGGLSAIHNGNFCNMPVVCVSCADRSSRRKKAIFKPRIEQAAARFKHCYMVTMTIRDGEILEDRLNAMVGSRKRFRLFGQKRILKRITIYQDAGKWYEGTGRGNNIRTIEVYRNDFGEWGKCKAAISSTEIIWGENSGKVHAHDHTLIFTDRPLDYRIYYGGIRDELHRKYGITWQDGRHYVSGIPLTNREYHILVALAIRDWRPSPTGPVPVSKISGEWHDASKGDAINIEVSPLSYRDYKANPFFKGEHCETFPKWISAQAGEVLKYNSKLAEGMQKREVTPYQYVHLIQRRGSRRLFNTYGAFRNRKDSLYFSEEEERYFEYVDWRENQSYEVRRATYDEGMYWTRYEKENRSIFNHSDKPDNERRAKLSRQADLVAWFRRIKAAALADRKAMIANTRIRGPEDTEEWKSRVESFIDREKRTLKRQLRELWLNAIPPGQARRFTPAPF